MTPEQYSEYAESLIEGHRQYAYSFYPETKETFEEKDAAFKIEETINAIRISISDVQHTIQALEKAKWKIDGLNQWFINEQITYYQQALTYLNSKLK